MKCPYCTSEDIGVIDSRSDKNNGIKRRRRCNACGKRFNTLEKIEMIPLLIVKKDKNREVYDRTKIESGIIRACHKRPVSGDATRDVVDRIEEELYALGENEIDSQVVGELVMKYLKDLDTVAYIRFASVYREFKDGKTFIEELDKIL